MMSHAALTPHFTLGELTVTRTGLPNQPTPAAVEKLFYCAYFQLEPIRARYGPLIVSSAYRSPEVNQAVGGVPHGQHPKGEAVDFEPADADIEVVFRWIVDYSRIRFGQAILEAVGAKRWIHLSLPRPGRPNQEALRYDGQQYAPFR